MSSLPHIIIYIALAAVLIVLLMGLFNMMCGGSKSTSQKLMRWRVGLQFLAIVIMMGTLYFIGG